MKKLIMFLTVGAALAISYGASASSEPPPPPDPIPVDGGASLLLAAGAAYGAKKWHEYRKNKNAESNDNTI